MDVISKSSRSLSFYFFHNSYAVYLFVSKYLDSYCTLCIAFQFTAQRTVSCSTPVDESFRAQTPNVTSSASYQRSGTRLLNRHVHVFLFLTTLVDTFHFLKFFWASLSYLFFCHYNSVTYKYLVPLTSVEQGRIEGLSCSGRLVRFDVGIRVIRVGKHNLLPRYSSSQRASVWAHPLPRLGTCSLQLERSTQYKCFGIQQAHFF